MRTVPLIPNFQYTIDLNSQALPVHLDEDVLILPEEPLPSTVLSEWKIGLRRCCFLRPVSYFHPSTCSRQCCGCTVVCRWQVTASSWSKNSGWYVVMAVRKPNGFNCRTNYQVTTFASVLPLANLQHWHLMVKGTLPFWNTQTHQPPDCCWQSSTDVKRTSCEPRTNGRNQCNGTAPNLVRSDFRSTRTTQNLTRTATTITCLHGDDSTSKRSISGQIYIPLRFVFLGCLWV